MLGYSQNCICHRIVKTLSVLNSENSVSWGIYMIEHWQIILKICHFKVVYLVAKPLIWCEAEGDLVGIETSI